MSIKKDSIFNWSSDQYLTKRSLVKQYSTYNMYKSSGQIIIQTTRYPVKPRYIIERDAKEGFVCLVGYLF